MNEYCIRRNQSAQVIDGHRWKLTREITPAPKIERVDRVVEWTPAFIVVIPEHHRPISQNTCLQEILRGHGRLKFQAAIQEHNVQVHGGRNADKHCKAEGRNQYPNTPCPTKQTGPNYAENTEGR